MKHKGSFKQMRINKHFSKILVAGQGKSGHNVKSMKISIVATFQGKEVKPLKDVSQLINNIINYCINKEIPEDFAN